MKLTNQPKITQLLNKPSWESSADQPNSRAHLLSFLIFTYLFILAALALRCGTRDLRCGMWTLSCGMWDLVPWPGIEPGPPALGAQSLSHWTTRDIPQSLSSKSPTSFHCAGTILSHLPQQSFDPHIPSSPFHKSGFSFETKFFFNLFFIEV